MKNINKITSYALAVLLLVSASCTKDYIDPQKANESIALSSPRGLTAVTVGIQRLYTLGRTGIIFNSVTANGFVSNELELRNAGNIPELQLSTGGTTIDGTNSILNQLWTNANKIIYDSDQVINNAELLTDKSYASGLIAYASIFKALAIGNLSTYWDNVPAEVGKPNVAFITRIEGYNQAIAAIDKALAVISANAISPSFITNMPAGIDIPNTLYALKARYALFAGNYALALSSANSVDLSKRSVFIFDAVSLNPIFQIATSTNNVFQPINANLGLSGTLQPDAADKRIPFYTSLSPTIAPLVRINGFGATAITPIPLYLPSEMTLIKAEVLARQPDLSASLIELNKVITKTPASDPFGIGADLPALTGTFTQTELLEQIYKQRSIELFMSGLRLEDMRRLQRPVTERKRSFFPYPFTERDNNTNTPKDPTF
ncbi:RagB/SusD family nutrient uptake outer membrane protein [Daejeonella oryzae]|uniref:RagB/SusD family nutrient uptake outer membrane protein n=1 Tax=Daejeonella oryzae TaxID=1122943 RepID=UPI00040C4A6F|nr:RagB/SusD family nutrient uptake outer membrane protein [Daejeonella oryzae]